MEWLLSLIRTKIHMKYRSEFGESNIIQNSNRAVISTLLVAVLELVILANTYRGTVEVLYGSYLGLYRSLYLVMSITSVLGTIALIGFKNHPNKSTYSTRIVMVQLVIFINWAVIVSIVDGVRDIQSNFYMFIALSISVIAIMRPIRGLLLFGSSMIIYMALTYVFISDSIMAFGNYINSLSIYSTAWIISMLFYKFRADAFIKQKVIFEQNEQLKHIVSIDPLTGIYNRRALDTQIESVFKKSATNELGMLVMMIDIDYYKGYNDSYGHIKGDQVLIQVANTLKDITGAMNNVICRYGGDEFCVVLECDSEIEAHRLRDLMHVEIKRLAIPNKASKISKYLTISVGVKYIIPLIDDSPWTYIEAADKNLYKIKTNRMNRRMDD